MGICSAPEVFQKAMSQHLEDLEGCAVTHDDIVVWAETEEKHDARLDAALRRLEDIGLGLNYEKCLFKMTQMPYMEDFTREGAKPDPEKVQATKDMPVPSDVTELHKALGLAKYLGKFIPNLSSST